MTDLYQWLPVPKMSFSGSNTDTETSMLNGIVNNTVPLQATISIRRASNHSYSAPLPGRLVAELRPRVCSHLQWGVMAVWRPQLWCHNAWRLASLSTYAWRIFTHFRSSDQDSGVRYALQMTGRDSSVSIPGMLTSEFVAGLLRWVSAPPPHTSHFLQCVYARRPATAMPSVGASCFS